MPKKEPKKITFTVVGIHHHTTPPQLEEIIPELPLMAQLKREPDNLFDRNAVAVYVDQRPFNFKIGYLPRKVAEVVAPKIDAGEFASKEIWLTTIEPADEGGEGHIGEVLCW